jgi:hypothetical protein
MAQFEPRCIGPQKEKWRRDRALILGYVDGFKTEFEEFQAKKAKDEKDKLENCTIQGIAVETQLYMAEAVVKRMKEIFESLVQRKTKPDGPYHLERTQEQEQMIAEMQDKLKMVATYYPPIKAVLEKHLNFKELTPNPYTSVLKKMLENEGELKKSTVQNQQDAWTNEKEQNAQLHFRQDTAKAMFAIKILEEKVWRNLRSIGDDLAHMEPDHIEFEKAHRAWSRNKRNGLDEIEPKPLVTIAEPADLYVLRMMVMQLCPYIENLRGIVRDREKLTIKLCESLRTRDNYKIMAKLIVEKSERDAADRAERKDQAEIIAANAEIIRKQKIAMQALTIKEKDLTERKTKLDEGELLLQQANNEMKKREEILKNIEEAQREGTTLHTIYEKRDKELRNEWRNRRKELDESKGGEFNKQWKDHYDKKYNEEVAAVNEEKKGLWQREDKIAADTTVLKTWEAKLTANATELSTTFQLRGDKLLQRENKIDEDTTELKAKAAALEAEKTKFEELRANWKAEKTALEVRIDVLQLRRE